jgi:hypothetical protein
MTSERLVGVRAQKRAYSHVLINLEGSRTGKLMPPDYWQRPCVPWTLDRKYSRPGIATA